MKKIVSKSFLSSFEIKGFDQKFFEKKKFDKKTISRYFKNALKNFKIAQKYREPEIVFKFCYDCLIKIGICVIASKGFRVKSRQGHHFKILEKLSEILMDEEILIVGDAMRKKRNLDLYGEGIIISQKEANDYLKFIKKVINSAEKYLKSQSSLF